MRRESGPTCWGEGVGRLGFAVDEAFFHRDVLGVFEFAEVGAEVAVGFAEEVAEFGEGQRVGCGEQGAGAQPRAVLEQLVEALRSGGDAGELRGEVGLGGAHKSIGG